MKHQKQSSPKKTSQAQAHSGLNESHVEEVIAEIEVDLNLACSADDCHIATNEFELLKVEEAREE